MPLETVTIPCLADNYAFLVHNTDSGETALVDAPESGPILSALNQLGWTLDTVLLTHHHWDHVDGLAAILEVHKARVIGAKADAHRLPALDLAVSEGNTVTVCGEEMTVLDVSGHTVGHVAFHFPATGVVFTADSLMALGCGRLFEGTPAQMWQSLGKLAALPGETMVCSGHEYTETNLRFALTVDPDNPALKARGEAIAKARKENRPTVPSILSEEMATNPFLRADDPAIRAQLGMQDATDTEVFTEIRRLKDAF